MSNRLNKREEVTKLIPLLRSPFLVHRSSLKDLLLFLRDEVQGVDEGGAPVERVPGHQDEGGLGHLHPAPVNELLQVEGGLCRGLAHVGDVAGHPDVTV